MNFKSVFGALVLVLFFAAACNNDDDNGPTSIPLRDQAEQYVVDNDSIVEFLQTHFYELDAEGEIVFDTIAGDNAGRTPLFTQVETKVIETDEVDFNLYILTVRQGSESEGNDIRVTDSTLVTYRGRLLDNTQFDRAINPIWFDLTGVIRGFSTSFSEFTAGNGISETNDDGTVTFADFAQGAVFIPSGLGYFERAQPGIPFYSPLSFTFKIFKLEETDHDNDGIPSYMEDLDNNENPFDDDTDGDTGPNYLDADDDGDGTLTRDEIVVNEDGTITFTDTDGDGTPDYLDNRNDN
ncbi:FKBP-type peptidyl-prolyl cis-trans isomerase [Spongiivirga citrea]|uniref:peptidylprolyl isomerase n=1 Tax=Spongiivirga citrea TaxID=1481457 RepID=A0A6M0CPG2_9FLAO|nr:hypothetical protein [Spongiivirga citrea]NER15810.1 hypothetical protein [Spongiivirga citrea]